MELSDWQIRLEKHFDQLRIERSAISTSLPIYGLEHGLEKEEFKLLSRAIKDKILKTGPSKAHQLVWIVYASEIGYDYAGDEYWQTFERETPGWSTNGDRYWLRNCFLWFHQKYYAARPTGRWAEHFSIICWPITHAILPKDLQRQLARILYELRYSFSAELLESPTILGARIAAKSWNATSRFQNFVEETQLVGQIAAVLLLQGKFGTAGLLHEGTLQRISEDLNRERMAREWLRNARQEAEKRVHFRGIGVGQATAPLTERSFEKVRSHVQALGIEPRLILRPNDTQKNLWDVLLEIPDFSHLLFHFPNFRDILTGSRCIVAGSSGRPLARGSFLYGSQRILMSKWPDSDEILIKFDKTDAYLEYLLKTEFLLRPEPTRIFRIATDNLAYEMRSLSVRPGGRYIIIDSKNLTNINGLAKSIRLTCNGIYGIAVDLPEILTDEWQKWLSNAGIQQTKTIEVWPAGLGAASWDGEGYGEWLVSERPCLGICSDHPIDSLLVSMDVNSKDTLEIAHVTPGEPFFVELPELSVGLHRVKFLVRRALCGEEEELGDLEVVMRIRETRPWSPGITPHGPLSVKIDPPSPTLEQLWDGKVDITIHGPKSRQIECKVSLFEVEPDKPTCAWQLLPLELPLSPHIWRASFDKYVKNQKDSANAYDAARACELNFSADELGAFSLRCEREFKPLRWTLHRETKGYRAKIFDDSGNADSPVINRYQFETPTIKEDLEYKSVYYIADTGGLYIARQGNLCASIIIPPSGTMHNFSGLRCIPRFDPDDLSFETLVNLIRLSEIWSKAQLPGDPISTLRQHDILLAITRQVFLILSGKQWCKTEEAILNKQCNLSELARIGSRQGNEKGLIAFLERNHRHLAGTTCTERVRQFAAQAVECLKLKSVPPKKTVINDKVVRLRPIRGSDNVGWLCELALRLASEPSTAEKWAGDGFIKGMERLSKTPILAAAARFLVIATTYRQTSLKVIPGKLYSYWEWS